MLALPFLALGWYLAALVVILLHLHAWHVPDFHGTLQAHEHQALVWCSPEEALQYPLAPADIPLLEAFMALRAARPAD